MISGQTSMTEISKRESISMGGGKPGNTVQWKRQFGTIAECKKIKKTRFCKRRPKQGPHTTLIVCQKSV